MFVASRTTCRKLGWSELTSTQGIPGPPVGGLGGAAPYGNRLRTSSEPDASLFPPAPQDPPGRTARSWGVIHDSLELAARPPRRLDRRACTGDSLSRAVHTHALCVHTQERPGGVRRPASHRETAAHRLPVAAHILHTHALRSIDRA